MNKLRIENATDLAVLLAGRKPESYNGQSLSEVVQRAQRAARILHRHDERRCNEDLTCPKCQGQGCKKCGESGDILGRKDARLVELLRSAVKPYRLRVYEQGDPRGWPLYLIPEEAGPVNEDGGTYNSRGFAVCPH